MGHGRMVSEVDTEVVANMRRSDPGASGASSSWSNSLINGIYAAVSTQRHFQTKHYLYDSAKSKQHGGESFLSRFDLLLWPASDAIRPEKIRFRRTGHGRIVGKLDGAVGDK